MKKLLLICLLAGYSHCFAQNIELKDLQIILESPTDENVSRLLAPKGYTSLKENAVQSWVFKSDLNPEAPYLTQLYRDSDTSGTKLIYETTNPYFFTNLLKQLPANNFQYKLSATVNNRINLTFSNGKHEMLLDCFFADTEPYRIVLRPVPPTRIKLAPRYDHNVRHNTY